jgi:hypothetical protein
MRLNKESSAISTTMIPITAIIRKDIRRLDNPATIPIIGGPIKNPKKPMLDTAANAMPGEMVVDLPAWL